MAENIANNQSQSESPKDSVRSGREAPSAEVLAIRAKLNGTESAEQRAPRLQAHQEPAAHQILENLAEIRRNESGTPSNSDQDGIKYDILDGVGALGAVAEGDIGSSVDAVDALRRLAGRLKPKNWRRGGRQPER